MARLGTVLVPWVWNVALRDSILSFLEWVAQQGGEGADTAEALAADLRDAILDEEAAR